MPRHGPSLGAGSFPTANKLLARYEMDRAQKIHQQKLNSMKHRLDVKEPKRQNHLILRLKQIQIEEERQAEIDHENKLLLSKMTHVMKYGGNIDNWNNYESRSLNYPLREKQSEDIARENLGIARRLETVRPQLQINRWERDYQKHSYLKRLWSDSVKDFGEFTPRRFRSRMSKARSLENSLDEDDDDYDSVATSEDKRLPRIDKTRKSQNMRATQSETNAPVSSRREEPKPKPSTKLPKITPHKALIEHDYSMYYGSVSSLNKLPLDSERSIRPARRSLEESENEIEDSPYQPKPRDNREKADQRVDYDKEKVDQKDSSREKEEKKDKQDKKQDTEKDKSKQYKTSEHTSNKHRKKSEKATHKDKTNDEPITSKTNDEYSRNLHSNSQTSFRSAVLPTNDLERVKTLISEENDKDVDNEVSHKNPSDKDEDDSNPERTEGNDDIDTTEKQENAQETEKEENSNATCDNRATHNIKDDNDETNETSKTDLEEASNKPSDSKTVEEPDSTDKEGDCEGIANESKESASMEKELDKENDGGPSMTTAERRRKRKADGTAGGAQSQDDGSEIAQLFKIAKQLGKPEEIFIKTLIKKSHKQRMKMKTKFREKYDLDLIKELKNGLGQPWDRLIDALLLERGDSDSYTVFDALSTSDMCDIVELLCSRDNAAIADLKESYRKEFSTSLEEDVLDRTEPPVQTLLLALQKGSRDESSNVDIETARKDALDLHQHGEGRWDNENGMFLKLLNTRSLAHMQTIIVEYKSMTDGHSILTAMKADCAKDYYQILSTLVHCIGSPASHYAEQIHKHKLPTDQVLIDILVTRSEIDMPQIRKVYKNNFGVDIVDELKNKQHPTQKCLIELACKAPPGYKPGPDPKPKGGKGAPHPAHAKKPPVAAKKADSVRGKPDDTTARSDPVTKSKAQESKSKQDNSQGGAKKQHDADPAKKKKAGQTKEKEDGDHNGTVRPAASFKAEADCDRLHEAMSGTGTDEQVIVAIIPRRSNKQRQKLKQVYEQKFKKNLMIDLESELTGDTEEIVLALMMTKPEYDAYILHEAVEGLGTSEATLVGVLGSRSAEEMKAIREHYKKTYKTELELDVTRDTVGQLKELFTRLCRGERQEETSVNAAQAKKDAEALYQDGSAALDPSSKVFQDLLVCKNQYQVKATFEEYKKLAGHDFCTSLSKASLADDEETYISIANAVADPVTFHTEKIHSCFNNMGTNDNMLIRMLVSRAEMDTRDIKARYMELFSQSLLDVINRECRGDYKALLQAILDEKQEQATKAKKGDKSKKSGASVLPWKPFNPMEDSVRLHDAMQGLGADEDVVVDILPRRTNDQRQEIQAKFQDKYQKNLVSELKSELRGDFEELVLALMMKPLEYDAHCLHEAVDGLGTSEGILIGILSTRTGQELSVIKDHYKKTYGADLQQDITSDVSGDFEDMLVEILKCQREQGQKVNQQLAQDDAKKLYKDGQISIDPKDETFMAILAKRNRFQVRATFEEYKKLTGNDIYFGIDKAFMADTERGYKGLAKAIEDPVQYYTERLKDSIEGIGTNDKLLIRIIVSRSEIDLQDIKSRFQSLYKRTVADCVESECSGDYKRMLLALLGT